MSATNEFLVPGRRAFLVAGVGVLLSSRFSLAAGARDPLTVIQAIYRLAVKGKGPSWIEKEDRPKDLSNSLVAL